MEKKKPWYLEERAEQLAIIHLSSRSDLVPTRQSADDGLDLLVAVTKDGKYTGRIFGVQVKALQSSQRIHPNPPNAEEFRLPVGKLMVPEDIPFPLCVFVFVMETDDGYYKWIKKPVYGPDGRSQLALDQASIFRELNADAISKIVGEINAWYESKIKIPA